MGNAMLAFFVVTLDNFQSQFVSDLLLGQVLLYSLATLNFLCSTGWHQALCYPPIFFFTSWGQRSKMCATTLGFRWKFVWTLNASIPIMRVASCGLYCSPNKCSIWHRRLYCSYNKCGIWPVDYTVWLCLYVHTVILLNHKYIYSRGCKNVSLEANESNCLG